MRNGSHACLFFALLLAAAAPAGAQTATKCFRAEWLQGARVVNFNVEGGEVKGTFTVEGDGGGAYEFTGRLSGDTLTVAFAGGRRPDVSPSEMTSLVWTLTRDGGREMLRIKFRGRNYETGRHEDGFADFAPCDAAGYKDLAEGAQTVRFARGASSASFALGPLAEFQSMRRPAAFLISAAKSQTLEVTAEGCAIQVYLPGGKLYEFVEWEGGGEKTFVGVRLDRLLIESLPQTGTYLVVLRKPAENAQAETVTFKATNRPRPPKPRAN